MGEENEMKWKPEALRIIEDYARFYLMEVKRKNILLKSMNLDEDSGLINEDNYLKLDQLE